MYYRVRVDALRREMAKPRRLVPHSVRSLAKLAGVSKTLIGALLTGEKSRVGGDVAASISEALETPVDDLFMPESYTYMNVYKSEQEATDD